MKNAAVKALLAMKRGVTLPVQALTGRMSKAERLRMYDTYLLNVDD